MKIRTITLLLIVVISFAGSPVSLGQNGTFSVCFLDLDMPLSQKDRDEISSLQGIYFDLGKIMAEKLSKEFVPYFTMAAFHKRPVRAGLLAGNCQIQFGLPNSEGPEYIKGEVSLTKPILSMGYALVVRPPNVISNPVDFQGKKIGVQTGSPPQMALASMEQVKMEYYSSPELALEALDMGLLDAAFIWGPSAGYLNKFLYKDKFIVIPTNYKWPVSIGIHYNDQKLLEVVNKLIDDLKNDIDDLKIKYAFPQGQKIEMPNFLYDF